MPAPRPSAMAALLALLASAACQPENTLRGPGPPSAPGAADTADTGPGTDTGGGAPAARCTLRDVAPRTIPDAVETTVVWTLACADGAPAGAAWTAAAGAGTLEGSAAADAETLTLTAMVPAGDLGPGFHDLGEPTFSDGEAGGFRLPLRVHATSEAVGSALRGAGWNPWAGRPDESLFFYLGDPDGNGSLDLLSTAVAADGEVVQHAQQANGAGAFQDRRGLAHVEADGFGSGEGFWFESDTEGILSLIAATEAGEVAHVRKSTFVGRDWTETVLRVNHGFMAERVPDVLLAAEPEWYAPGVLLMNLLGLVDRGAGPLGLYCEGTVCWEWAAIGGLSPADVAAGDGFIGAFTDGELGALQPATSHPKFWSVDARTPSAGLPVNVIDYDYHTENWGVARPFVLPDPGFVVEAVSGAGQDLDGDGSWELVLELWGEGGWQAWLIRGADDKSDEREPLLLGAADARALWGSPAPSAAGATAIVPSTFVASGRALRSTRLLADGPSVSDADAALVVVEEWSLSDVLDPAATAASPVQGAVAGRVALWPFADCARLDGRPLPACRRGMLPRSVAAAGVGGAPQVSDPYREGDHLLLGAGQGQGKVVVSRGVHPAGVAPGWLAATGAASGVAVRVGWADGLRLVVDGEDAGPLCHGRVQVAEHPDGPVILGQDPTDCADGTTSVWWPDGRSQRVAPPSGAAPSGVALLAARPGAEDAWPVGWRDASGAGWLGRLALSPDADPAWSDAALAIGVGGAPLSGGDHRPGVVAVAPPADAGWPAAPVEGWSSGADLDADASDGLVVGLVPAAAAACPWQSAVVVGAGDAVGSTLFDSADPTCADLPVPLAAGRLDGASEVVLSASADGRVVLTRFDGASVWHRDLALDLGAEAAPDALAHARISTGDLNGDALDDVLVSQLVGAPAQVFLSDGEGGWLAADEPGALGGGLNAVGLAGPAPGRPAPAVAWDGTLPTLQRPFVPVTAP